MYRITFSDNKYIDCCKDHLWKIYDQGKERVVDTNWFMQLNHNGVRRCDALKNKSNFNYYIPKCKPVEFEHREIILNPYVLGALLGGGSFRTGSISFTTEDPFIKDTLNYLLPDGYKLNLSKSMQSNSYNIIGEGCNEINKNKVKQIIKDLGLYNKNSQHKFIPDCYKYTDIDTRIQVLKGLIDTDGYVSNQNLVQYTTGSEKLCDDVEFLVESLGGLCTKNISECGYNNKVTGVAYTLTIKMDDPTMICSLPRKLELLKIRRFTPRRNIIKIEKIQNTDAKCIAVEGPSSLYLAEHFIVTHNTKQSIDIAVARKQLGQVTQCLIICGVNSLKYNWENEIHTHSNESCFILGSRLQKNGKSYIGSVADRISDLKTHKEFFQIFNIECLRNDDFIKELRKKDVDTTMIVFDEFHHCLTPTSAQSRGLQKLTGFKNKIALTGTPIINRPTDVFIALKWLGVENSNFSTFKNYYCTYGGFGGHEITGYKNLGTLRQSLSSCMLRRLKEEELDLPPKIEQTEIIELGYEQQKIYNEVQSQVRDNIDLIINSPNPLTQLLRLRQATGYTGILSSVIKESAKFDRLKTMIDDLVDSNKKCIVFSNWTSITDEILPILSKYKPALITGQINIKERQNEVDRFQNDPRCKVLVGTIGAAGTGLTLTAASYVFFLDLPWTYASYAQASDRAYRIGTTGTVNIISMLAKNTIDERIWNLIHTKKNMSDMLVDGKQDDRMTKKLTRQELLYLIQGD